MSKYIDGFLIPIEKDKVDDYQKISQKVAEVFKEYGAIEYCECVGDDLDIEGVLSFRNSGGATKDETVLFAWIVYESKEQRDKISQLVMNDQRMKDECNSESLVDYKKLVYSGFKPLVKI